MKVESRLCDVCNREITGRVLELRLIVAVDEPDGGHREHATRAENCSPACAITFVRGEIDRYPTSTTITY